MTRADSDEPGSVVTFYSYKGGTGRSMALANVACLLALRQTAAGGKRVLAIDWDLEAPGLHRYFQPYLRADEPRPGLIDLFEDARSRLDAMSPTGDEETRARTLVEGIHLDRYVIPTSYPSLSLIRAGRFEETYSERVNTFPWQSFFRSVPSFYRLFAERLAGEYSWILVDSRTGLTDISGVCTMLMPEKLVVVFTPNQQSLTGIVPLIRRATEYRRGSDDLRPLVVYPLPSRIETSMQPLAQRWRLGDPSQGIDGWQQQFNAVFREVYDLEDDFTLERYFDEVQLQHVAPYSYGEPLPVTEERGSDRLTLTNSYETFRGYLEADAPWAERKEPTVADAQEVRIQADRLHEAARAQSTSRPWTARAEHWMSANRAVRTVVLLALLFSVAGIVATRATFARTEQRGFRLLSATLRDAGRNPNAVTALLLEHAQADLSGDDRAGALRALTDILEEMPEQSKRIPVKGGVNWLELSPDGKSLLVVAGDRNLTVREIATGKVQDLGRSYSTARFADDGSIVGEADGKIVRVDQQDRKRIFAVEGKLLAMSPHGRYVSAIRGKRVVVSEIDGKPVLSVSINDPYPEPQATYYKEELVGVWQRRAAVLGNLRTGAKTEIPLDLLAGPYAFTNEFAAVTVENSDVYLWRLQNATAVPLRLIPGNATALVFSPAADRLAMALDGGNLAIVDPAQRESGSLNLYADRLVIQRAKVDTANELIWVGEHLVALGDDWLEVFDASRFSARPLRFQVPAGAITQVRTVGDLVAVGTKTGTEKDTSGEVVLLKLTPLPDLTNLTTPERRRVICARTGRDLTSEEWSAYGGKDVPYSPICKAAP